MSCFTTTLRIDQFLQCEYELILLNYEKNLPENNYPCNTFILKISLIYCNIYVEKPTMIYFPEFLLHCLQLKGYVKLSKIRSK